MLTARQYVEKVRSEIEAARSSRLWTDSVNMLQTVAESVFSRSAHFILELLQNAEDSGLRNCSSSGGGEIEFTISRERIRVSHNGTPFVEDDVDAICGVRSTKKPELGTLGFLGIGFKSVFKVTDCPQVHSGEFHFRFDKTAHTDAANVPWQIMPIWEEVPSEPIEPDRTTFILPFRSTELYEQTREELKKLDVHVFLFLKWLKRLRIVDESNGQSIVVENLGETDGFVSIKKGEAVQRFVVCRRTADVPPEVASDPVLLFYKRQNVSQREVVIAFAVDADGNLQSVEDASALGSVSSFLPLVEERSGAKFLIQADFLVQPGREAIQYELAWNRWLVKEAVEAAKEAIEKIFKPHPEWRRQFLLLFSFKAYSGQPAYDKLFGPCLQTPLLEYLRTAEVMATETGSHVRADLIVNPDEGLRGLLTDADLPLLFPNRKDLRLLDPKIDVKSLPHEIQQSVTVVELGQAARNKSLLESKVEQPDWFRRLFQAMAETHKAFKETMRHGRRGRIEWVDDPIYVLTEAKEILPAKGVYLRSIPKEVLELRSSYAEVDALLRTYKLLHPALDSEELNRFFSERTHVEAIDYEKICRSVFLPKMRTEVRAPPKAELLAYTRLLQKGPSVNEPIWVLTASGDTKPSNQVFMGTAYSPAEDWQTNAHYSPQIDFLSPEYLDGVPTDDRVGWKEFFTKVGVKESGERNHVEMFAMAFVEEKLAGELSDFIPKDRQQVGYDREARRKTDGALVKLEIKGQRKEQPVQLVGNEPDVAKCAHENNEPFWVCVVVGIPEKPQLWVVEDAVGVGSFNTLTIDVSDWKTHGRRVG
jgi:hypothetical protein